MSPVLIIMAGIVLIVLVGGAFLGNRLANRAANRLTQPRQNAPTETPAEVGVADAETVQFPAGDLTLTAWFIPPAPDADGATLLYVHGFLGNRQSLLEQAVISSSHGYGALLIDLRNHGDSDTAVTTWGYAEALDVQAAYDYLLSREEVNPEKIGIVGKSMGGAAVVEAAVNLPDVSVLVIESTYQGLAHNLPSITMRLGGAPGFLAPLVLPKMEQITDLPLREVRALDDFPQLNMPVLFIHGERDEIVSVDQGQAMFAAANEPKELYLIPNAGHLNIVTADPTTFEQRFISFLDTYLR